MTHIKPIHMRFAEAMPNEKRQAVISYFADAHDVFIGRGERDIPVSRQMLLDAYAALCEGLSFIQGAGEARALFHDALRQQELSAGAASETFADDDKWNRFIKFEKRILRSYKLYPYQVDALIDALNRYRELTVAAGYVDALTVETFDADLAKAKSRICGLVEELDSSLDLRALMSSGGLTAGGALIKYANVLGDATFGLLGAPPTITAMSIGAGETMSVVGTSLTVLNLTKGKTPRTSGENTLG